MISNDLQQYLKESKEKRNAIIQLAQSLIHGNEKRFKKSRYSTQRLRTKNSNLNMLTMKGLENTLEKPSMSPPPLIDYSLDRSFITPTTKEKVIEYIYTRDTPVRPKSTMTGPVNRLRRYKIASPNYIPSPNVNKSANYGYSKGNISPLMSLDRSFQKSSSRQAAQ